MLSKVGDENTYFQSSAKLEFGNGQVISSDTYK